jgi:molybdopterin molybdotransferase
MGQAPVLVDFDAAIAMVLDHAAGLAKLASERVGLSDSRRRVLAEEVRADRDQPPFDRSTRDGFALRADDAGPFKIVGQVRAGEVWQGPALEAGRAIEIMTGAPIPAGASAVVMVEHVERSDDALCFATGRTMKRGENIVPRAAEGRAGEIVLAAGTVMEAAEIALAAACGYPELTVFVRPKIAIIATGDELVEVAETPESWQIRNSNSYALKAMVESAGGSGTRLPVARDTREDVRDRISQGRMGNLMVFSGGVSMGEYDLVEEVLAEFNAEFFFTGVRMQPGKPVVFGRLPERLEGQGAGPACYFFGLPGNPISTQVTFHCFVEPLLRAMAGAPVSAPRFVQATLAEAVEGKPGLTRVLPASLKYDRVKPEVRVVGWQGSGDQGANARANCYAVLPSEQQRFAAGDVITVLLR